MSHDLHKQIHNSLNLRETQELLDIWQANDKEEWSETAFDVIWEILNNRGVEIPEQDEFIPSESNDKKERDDEEFTEVELKIINDKDAPAFYDPFEVLKISSWIEIAAKAMVGFIVLANLVNFSTSRNIVHAYFVQNPIPILENILTLFVVALNAAIAIAIYYFTLITLARILNILMEMEFNSRIDK